MPGHEVPRHVAVFPDGNRRWARARGLPAHHGYAHAVEPLLLLCGEARRLGIAQLTLYGMSTENTGRLPEQVAAIQRALVDFTTRADAAGYAVYVVGDASPPFFPAELVRFLDPPSGRRGPRVNVLVNYGWEWDLALAAQAVARGEAASIAEGLGSRELPPVDLVLRWSGRQRLSGMLPVQTTYANVVAVPEPWPSFHPRQLEVALAWHRDQALTYGL